MSRYSSRYNLVTTGGLVGLLCFAGGARAQVLFSFTANTQTSAPNSTVIFAGTITNNTASTVFLNGDSFSLIGNGLTLDDTKFNSNAPLSLSPGGTTGAIGLFDVTIDPTAANGSYPGSFTVQGGGPGITDPLVSQPFTINVAPARSATTPEPGVLGLLSALGMPAALLSLRRLRRR